MTDASKVRASARAKSASQQILVRPFRGPRAFLQNASIAIQGRELTITDRDGVDHSFDLDDARGPYGIKFVAGRFAIVDADLHAVLITREHLWDIGDLHPIINALGPAPPLSSVPVPRGDGVVMKDRQAWDIVPQVAIGPFMVGPLVLGRMADTGAISERVAIAGAFICLVVVAVSGAAMVRGLRTFQMHKLRRKGPKVLDIVAERGDVLGELDLRKAERLVIECMPESLMAFEAGATVTPLGPEREALAEPSPLGLHMDELLGLAHEYQVVLEIAPYTPVPMDKTIELAPYSAGGTVTVAMRRGNLIVTDRKGRTNKVSCSAEEGPARIALAFAGFRFLSRLLARLIILDRRNRVILQTPLSWWEMLEEGYRSVFALARALEVPIELIDGRRRSSLPRMAPGGIRYIERPVAWYTIGIVSVLLMPLFVYFLAGAISEFVFELPESLMTALSVGSFIVWGLAFAILTLTRGSFRIWTKRG